MCVKACKTKTQNKKVKSAWNWLIHIKQQNAVKKIEVIVIYYTFCLCKVCETMQWSSVYREITDSAAQGQCGHRAKVFYHK